MTYTTKRSKVSHHKKSMSNRTSQGSRDKNYLSPSDALITIPFWVWDSEQKKDVKNFKSIPLFKYSIHNYASVAVGSRKRDTSNPWFIFHPHNKDFRPFLWKRPKPYDRIQRHQVGNVPSVLRTKPWGSTQFPANDYKLEDPYVYLPETFRFRDTPTFSARSLHYLNFNKKLADQKVDVFTTIAEGAATISMLANAAKDVFDFYRAVKKADIKTISRLFKRKNITRQASKGWKNKTAESRWLELQYGWSPMIGDLGILMEELAKPSQVVAPLIKVNHSTMLKPSDHYDSERIRDVNFFGILKTSCYYTVTPDGMRQAAQWNLGNNPLLTAWELVPYSFVVDWFLPIGDFLTQMSASQGLQFVSGTTVSHIRYSGTVFEELSFLQEGSFLDLEFSHREYGFRTQRIAHATSPIGLPVFSGGLSVKRALNALALISQRR